MFNMTSEPMKVHNQPIDRQQSLFCWLCAALGVPTPFLLFWALSHFFHLRETGANYLGGAMVFCFVVTQLEIPRPVKWGAWGAFLGMVILIPAGVIVGILRAKSH